jgi:hypothetical protein
MGPIGTRRRFYAIRASAFKAFTALTGSREKLTYVPARNSTGNVVGRTFRNPTFAHLVSVLAVSRVMPSVHANREGGGRPQLSWQRSHNSEWNAFGRRPERREAQRLRPHPQEAKVPSRGFYVPRNLLPQSFH